MQIHLVSDLHLEFQDFELPGGEMLIIAGDMCEARSFFRNDSGHARKTAKQLQRFVNEEITKYEDYIYVLGNHEPYGRSVVEAKKLLLNAGVVPDDGGFIAGGYAFYGCTLWTDANKGDPNTAHILQRSMNDFRCIEDFSVDRMRHLHKVHLESMQHFLNTSRDYPVVIVTHHAPTNKSVNVKYINDWELNGGYRSDLSDFILDNPRIKLWCHGHMHDYCDYTIGDTRVVCNPRGYYGYENNAYTYKVLEINL